MKRKTSSMNGTRGLPASTKAAFDLSGGNASLNCPPRSLVSTVCLFLAILLLTLGLCTGLCGCAGKDSDEKTIRVFYLNKEKTGLVPKQKAL